jgi:ribose 5-phosphate isomerase B
MKVGIAADHGGFEMKQKLIELLTAGGHEVVDFGDRVYDESDDYPDFAIPWPTRWRLETCSEVS